MACKLAACGISDNFSRSGSAAMIVFGMDKSKLMDIQEFSRKGSEMIFKGKIMGAMPVTGVLKPSEARAALKMLNFKMILFLLSLPFRSDN